MMYNVSYAVLCAKVIYKENFVMQQQYKQGAWPYNGNKRKYHGDTPFKSMLMFVKLAVELLAL